MNIRDQRQRAVLADIRKSTGRFHIGDRQSRDLTAGSLELTDLLQRTFHVCSFGIEHRLDDHRGTAADGYAAYIDLLRHLHHPLINTKISLNMITAISTSSRIMPAP